MDKHGRNVPLDVQRSVHVANTFYLFYYGGKACLLPFLTLYFRQIGLSASQTGLALGIKALICFCVSPIWLALERRVRKTRTILCYSIFILIGSNLALTVLHPADPQLPLQFCRDDSPPFFINRQNVTNIENVSTALIFEDANRTSTMLSTALPHRYFPTTVLEVNSRLFETTTAPDTTSLPVALSSEQGTAVKEENVAVTTTATEIALSTTTMLPIFQLAKSFIPVLKGSGLTSSDGDLILEFIEEQKHTSEWPTWKQAVLVRHVVNLLKKDEEQNLTLVSRGVDSSSSGTRSKRGIGSSEGIGSLDSNGTESSSMFEVIQNINLTSESEKRDAACENWKVFTHNIALCLSSNSKLFWYIFIILAAGELLSGPVELISDNSLYNLLDEMYSLKQYGKHRSSALIGVAVCGITSSIIVYFSPCFINGTINRFHIHFYLFALMLGISFVLATFYPSYDPVSNTARSRFDQDANDKCSAHSLTICSSCRHFLLFVTMLVVGIAQAPMQNFLFWMVLDMEGSSELVYGSFVSVNALCAMVSGSLGRKMMKVLKPCGSALVSLMFIAIQLVCCAFVTNPWLILPLQLLNIPGISFLWMVVSQHTSTTMLSGYEGSQKIGSVHAFARMSQQRTIHATYISIYQGLAFGVGSIMSGFLYDYTGGWMLPIFVGCGILVAVWGIVFAMFQCCCSLSKVTRKYSQLLSDSESDMDQAEIDEFNRNCVVGNGACQNFQKAKEKRKRQKKVDHSSVDIDAFDKVGWLKTEKEKNTKMF